MGTKTGIEWTDATWNPIRGCRNYYAQAVANRFCGHKAAGHLLDGVEWHQFPEVRA